MRSKFICSLCALLLAFSCRAVGQSPQTGRQLSPVGRWKTVDDATGKVNSIVAIRERDGRLYGEIVKLVNPDPRDPNPHRVRCEGEARGKPLVGLRILWDLRKVGDQWSGGKVLDPDNGRVYRCYLTLEDDGKKLKVRGFIGLSVFGRTEQWLRVE